MLKKCVSIIILFSFTVSIVIGDIAFVYARSGQTVTRIAVLPFHNVNEEAMRENLGSNVTSMMETELKNRNVFQVIDQNQVLQLVRELNLQASRTADPQVAQIIGDRLGAQAYIYGSVSKMGAVIGIDFQLVETTRGEVIFADQITNQSGFDIQTLIIGTVRQIEEQYFNQFIKDVTFSSNPSDADVYIDDVEKGKTPLSVKLSRGTHNVIVGKTGYRAWVQTINVGEEENSYIITLTSTTAVAELEKDEIVEEIVKDEPPPVQTTTPPPPAVRKKSGGNAGLYLLAGAVIVGGVVAAVLLTQKEEESNNTANVDITVIIPN